MNSSLSIYIYFHGPTLSFAIGKQWKLNDLDNMVSVISLCLPFKGMPNSTKLVICLKQGSFVGSESFLSIIDVWISLYQYPSTVNTVNIVFSYQKNLLLFFMTLFPVQIPLHLHINHSISFSIFTHITKSVCIFIEFALTLQINLEITGILTVFNFPIKNMFMQPLRQTNLSHQGLCFLISKF